MPILKLHVNIGWPDNLYNISLEIIIFSFVYLSPCSGGNLYLYSGPQARRPNGGKQGTMHALTPALYHLDSQHTIATFKTMGSGQSKYGLTRNSSKYQQYPYAPPGYPNPYTPYMPGYGPPGFVPPPYPPQQGGFIPPAAQFGQGAMMPPPMLNWLPQDKDRKRKSKRRQSDRFVGGFNAEDPRRQEAPTRRARSMSQSRNQGPPVIPTPRPAAPAAQGPNRRAPTPFVPRRTREDEDDDDEEDRPRSGAGHARTPSRQSTVRYPDPPPIRGDIGHVLEPLEAASAAAFGPTGPRPRTPLSNPLPPPPRDLYEMTPYKSLLSLPQTTALLTATYGPGQFNTAGALNPQPTVKRKKSGKGLFRAFSRKEKQKEPEQPQVRFIPVFVPADKRPEGGVGALAGTTAAPLQSSTSLHRVPSQMSHHTRPVTPGQPTGTTEQLTAGPDQGAFVMHPPPGSGPAPPGGPDGSPHPSIAPVPPVPSSPPAIRFDQESPNLHMFMNHSPHRILWQNKIYPSALHLHEALRFLDHRPDIAEMIRNTPEVHDVYPLSMSYQQFQRPDWSQKYQDFMDEVLYQKFRQHPDLRMTLLATGTARLIYQDTNDNFWGAGADGLGGNNLGLALCRVRDKLLKEGHQPLPAFNAS
ncbi:unnamed protein product [Cyclocybe aegerita]|uniref:NADAR domain-containing protein n=1 Tax=Cyclocybe aegerita TaxID=1973307 RepID=A0A8S0W0U0_CYCAE|nr:unnamed protein product [Cyclocybe aegerita]